MKQSSAAFFHRRIARAGLFLLAVLSITGAETLAADGRFVHFETGQVRPLALSAETNLLFAVNTPAGRLEIFDVRDDGIVPRASVPVGMDPVAVAIRSANEVWVVNHLSDSVSVVRIDASGARVIRTLLVGDEPRDIVFAGENRQRAFITTAHRGQQRSATALDNVPGAGNPELQTPGVPRADVWVFDAGSSPQTPVKIVELFGDTPRALAVSPDARTVYAAVFNSGNQTTTVSAGAVCLGFQLTPCLRERVTYPGGSPGPETDHAGNNAPQVGLIVKYNPVSQHFEDEIGRNWDAGVHFSLPDKDVFAIDAIRLEETQAYPHVGTTLFNMAVNPVNGTVYVSNTEANNLQRFEGPGRFGGSTVQGHIAESRITVIENGQVKPRHLNKHIDYALTPAPAGTAQHSLATPLDMSVSADGRTLYVAAFGSSRIGVYDTAALANDSFDPRQVSANFIEVSGGGPSGLILDQARNRMYVLTRFDNAVATVDLANRREIAKSSMQNPEPESIRAGRRFLYDARLTSSNGEASCSSCHIFGHTDHLAWDLGDPDANLSRNPIPIKLEIGIGTLLPDLGKINGTGNAKDFHPMKGPMATQTLRGMARHGAMHWRGDRATGVFGTDRSAGPPFDSRLAFKNFIVAFTGLNGATTAPSEQDMNSFADFTLPMVMPPNPVRNLDNSLTTAQRAGQRYYFGCDSPGFSLCSGNRPLLGLTAHNADGVPLLPGVGFTCNGCHTLDPARGFFGTDGSMSFEGLPQIMKIPQLRNVYEKVGKFGHPDVSFLNAGNNGQQGEQIRGFGYLHDGSIDTMLRFFNGEVFNARFFNQVGFFGGDPQRFNVVEYMLAFDSDLPPIVGQQVTYAGVAGDGADARIRLMMTQAGASYPSYIAGTNARACDLVASGRIAGTVRGWKFDPQAQLFRATRPVEPNFNLQQLLAQGSKPGQELTFTCRPFGDIVATLLN